MNNLRVLLSVIVFSYGFNANANAPCESGNRAYFEMPFRGEVRYSSAGDRLPRELVKSNARISFCQPTDAQKADMNKNILAYLDKAVADNNENLKVFTIAESYKLNRTLFVGQELFVVFDLKMPNGPEIPYVVRLTQNNDQFGFSKFPPSKDLETLLKYVFMYDKPASDKASTTPLSLSEAKLNTVVLHAGIIMPGADHPIFDSVESANKMIDEANYTAYLSLLDRRSFLKTQEFLESNDQDKKNDAAKFALGIPVIEYIVDANPIYLVAYKKSPDAIIGKGAYQEISGLSFQTFYGKNAETAKPWNLYFVNAQTKLLTSNGFYRQIADLVDN